MKIDPRVDNMLKITGDGRKAALDMHLVNESAEMHGDTKVSRAVDRIFATWDGGRDKRSTQLDAALDLDRHEAQLVAETPEAQEKAPKFREPHSSRGASSGDAQ
jgi:hypothetical protein